MAETAREIKNRRERERRKAMRARGLSEDQKAKHREHNRIYRERNREKIRARRDPDSEALRCFLYRKRKGLTWDRERYDSYYAQNPDALAAREKRKKQTASYKARRKIIDRKKHIARCKDKDALACRIQAHAERSLLPWIGGKQRLLLTDRLVRAVYSGRFPIRLTAEHAAEIMRELKMEHSNG